jgi:hypothetical protein
LLVSSLMSLSLSRCGMRLGVECSDRWQGSRDGSGSEKTAQRTNHHSNAKLCSFSLCGCADVRDRIFAMLGTPRIRSLGSWITLQADYAMTVGDLAVAVMTQYCFLKNRETKGSVVEVDHGLQFDSCLRLLLIGLGGSNCQHHLQRWIEQQIDGLWLNARGRLTIKLRALENHLNVGPVLQHMLTRDRVSDTAHRPRALRS